MVTLVVISTASVVPAVVPMDGVVLRVRDVSMPVTGTYPAYFSRSHVASREVQVCA